MISTPSATAAVLTIAVVLFSVSASDAQTEPLPTRMVTVERLQMRVWTAGLEQRKAGQPGIVLEAGSDATVETWKPIFSDLAQLAPVVAYDRHGLGQSAPNSLFVLAGHTGHQVHRDDPALVLQVVTHVLRHAVPAK